MKFILFGWVKSFAIFCYYASHNSAASDDFEAVVKVTNNTELWEAELAWYSPNATLWIWFYSLEHRLGIHSYRSTWSSLIVEVLATWAKFLKPSGYSTVINCAFAFHTTNVFSCCCSVMTQFEAKVPKLDYVACSSVWLLNHIRSEAMHKVSPHQLSRYHLSLFEQLHSRVICACRVEILWW